MSVSYGGDSITFADGSTVASGWAGFKNRIINGDMRIDQRNAGAAVTINTAGHTYTLDRWRSFGQATDGVFTVQQSTTAPSGFTNSVLVTVTTADASIGSTQLYTIQQPIEGLNISDLAWGTASAKAITVSFQVRSSVTGTFSGSIKNNDGTRSYPFTYAISSANTFETKSITISGDTTGTWLTTSGIGMSLTFTFGSGSNRLGTADTWAAANYDGATGSVSLISTLNATWYITGVQLEKGSTATSFDYRPYGTELALCQRYYAKFSSLSGVYVGFGSGVSTATTSAAIVVKYPVRMRSAPTISQSNSGLYDGGSIVAATSISTSYYGDESVFANINVASGMTLGRGCIWCGANNASAYIDFSSEL